MSSLPDWEESLLNHAVASHEIRPVSATRLGCCLLLSASTRSLGASITVPLLSCSGLASIENTSFWIPSHLCGTSLHPRSSDLSLDSIRF